MAMSLIMCFVTTGWKHWSDEMRSAGHAAWHVLARVTRLHVLDIPHETSYRTRNEAALVEGFHISL